MFDECVVLGCWIVDFFFEELVEDEDFLGCLLGFVVDYGNLFVVW